MIQPNRRVREEVGARGFALVRGIDFGLHDWDDSWNRLADDWRHLETDQYMSDGGKYRQRRYGRFCFVPAASELKRLPHAPVFQARNVNYFAGGISRNFAPLREATFENPCLLALIRHDFDSFSVSDHTVLSDSWEVWVHQIRIQATEVEVGRPAPEGIHHDGHDFIAMHLVSRDNVSGGRSLIYDNSKNPLFQCFLEKPLDTLYADDHRVMHNVEPISPDDPIRAATRDVLIIDYDHKPGLTCP